MSRQALEDSVHRSLENYFRELDGENAHNVYDMIMQSVEKPLLEFVMERAQGNQSTAASILGINRNTLRKKLQQHGLL